MTYKEQLLDPRWQKKRLEILDRDNWECKLCYDPGTTLHIHHLHYRKILAWEYQEHELITYCKHCHSVVEFYKKIDASILIAMVIKRPLYNDSQYLFVFKIIDGNTMVDCFEYGVGNTLKYLMTLDGFTIYLLNQRFHVDSRNEVLISEANG